MTDSNPFVYGRRSRPANMIHRDAELELVLTLADGGHHSRLTAPRRYGKTSLVRAALAAAAERGFALVYVNLYGILSVEDAVARLEAGYASLRGPVRTLVEGLVRTLRPTVALPWLALSLGVQP